MKFKKYTFSKNSGFYYNMDFWFSKAYQNLSPAARDLLQCLIAELKWDWIGKRKKIKVYKNNGSISFTENQFKGLRPCCSKTYLSARNQLIECGFIKQTHQGGTKRGDRAKYEILCVNNSLNEESRWRQYPQNNWSSEIPKAKNNGVGINTRFKKGQSGRKLKPTLLNDTHNKTNNPIEVDK